MIIRSLKEKLWEFTDYISSLYLTIKFTLVFSKQELNILDLTLHLKDGYNETDIFSKPTDSHLYLAPSSAHRSARRPSRIMSHLDLNSVVPPLISLIREILNTNLT